MADYIVVADKNLPALNEKINAAIAGGLMPIGEPVYAYGIFVQPCARMSAFPYITGAPQSIIADRDISSLAARVQALAGTGVSPSGGMQAFEGLFLQRMGMPDDMSSGGSGGGSQFAGIELMSADGWLQWRNKGEQTWHALEPLDTLKAQPNVLKVGTVRTLAAGSQADVDIIGETPNQQVDFNIPEGSKGEKGDKGDTGATGPKGDTGPQGPAGSSAVNPTPLNYETISATVVTAGTKVPVTFAKKYAVPPAVVGITSWNGSQMVSGFASEVTTTGCNVLVMQSVGTLLLNGSPFGSAPAGTTCRLLVLGTGA